MKQKTVHILIAETDPLFRKKLTAILDAIKLGESSLQIETLEVFSVGELGVAFYALSFDLIFIDYQYFVNNSKELRSIFDKTKVKCNLVLLVSGVKNSNISEILENINKYTSLYLSGHILKDNYSADMIRTLVEVFIKKVKINL